MKRHERYTLPPPIDRELVRLEGLLNDALWQRNETLATQLRREITRLRLLQSYGETHDIAF